MKWKEIVNRRFTYNTHKKGEAISKKCFYCWRPPHITCSKCNKTLCLEDAETRSCEVR